MYSSTVLANLGIVQHTIQSVVVATRLDVHLVLKDISLMIKLAPAKVAQKSTIPTVKHAIPILALVAS